MKSYLPIVAATAATVALVALVASCDPQASGTPDPSMVVIHDHGHTSVHHNTTVHVHGTTPRRSAPRATPPRTRTGPSTVTRPRVSLTKRR
ncbi:hypothetical protein ACFVY4_27040 [Streptomyces sp. NPDC058299]|uniref:hypothetical protein n=1 Tax=Streptomyces sp. NPDC058299 TaxID=3346435 RepID=UPI0036E3460F